MFCERCGTKIPDGQNQCPNCQAPVAQNRQMPYVPQVQPQMQSQPQMQPRPQMQPQPNFQLNNPVAAPVKPKKKSEGVNLLLVGGIALVVLVAIAVIVFGGVFASPQDKLMKMEKTAATLASKAIAGVYGDYVGELKDSLKKMENGTGAETQMTISADKTMLNSLVSAMLSEYMYGYGDMSSLDLSWLNNVVVNVDADVKGSAMGMKIGIGVNDTVLTSVVAQMDMTKNKIFMAVPELNPQYLYADLSAMDVDMSMASVGIEEMKNLVAALPSEKDVQKMLETYLLIIAAYADEVKEDKQTVTVADQTKEMKVLKAKISEKKFFQMVVDVLNTAVEDQTLKALIDAFVGYVNAMESKMYAQSGMTYTPVDVYAELKQELQNTVQNLQSEVENASDSNYMVLSNYITGGVIVGRRVQVYNEGVADRAPTYYMFIPNSDGGVFEVVLPEDGLMEYVLPVCTLSGKISGKSMDVDLLVEGQTIFTLRTQNLTMKDGTINGKIRLVPGKALFEEAGMDLPANITDVYLQMGFEGSKTDGSTEVKLVVGGNTMIGVTVSSKETQYDSFTEPANAVDVMSDDGSMWVTGLKLDTLIKNMQTAKIPNEYVQIIQQLEMMLALQ